MSIIREELKRMIDGISEQDALEVYDFTGCLNMKREKGVQYQLEVDSLAEDKESRSSEITDHNFHAQKLPSHLVVGF